MGVRSKLYITAFAMLLLATMFVDEVEGRRKILRGRKTITRTYYKPLALPAWAIIVCVGLAMVLVSGAVYFLLSKFYIKDLDEQRPSRINA